MLIPLSLSLSLLFGDLYWGNTDQDLYTQTVGKDELKGIVYIRGYAKNTDTLQQQKISASLNPAEVQNDLEKAILAEPELAAYDGLLGYLCDVVSSTLTPTAQRYLRQEDNEWRGKELQAAYAERLRAASRQESTTKQQELLNSSQQPLDPIVVAYGKRINQLLERYRVILRAHFFHQLHASDDRFPPTFRLLFMWYILRFYTPSGAVGLKLEEDAHFEKSALKAPILSLSSDDRLIRVDEDKWAIVWRGLVYPDKTPSHGGTYYLMWVDSKQQRVFLMNTKDHVEIGEDYWLTAPSDKTYHAFEQGILIGVGGPQILIATGAYEEDFPESMINKVRVYRVDKTSKRAVLKQRYNLTGNGVRLKELTAQY